MGDELTQYQRNLIRMWDSLRPGNKTFKGAKTCDGVSCSTCPFSDTVCDYDDRGLSFNAEKAIEIVTQWAKDHSVITMVDKYKETFGVEPIAANKDYKRYLCPKNAGFDIGNCTLGKSCSECCEKFWNSEYKKREVVQK